MSQRKLTDTMHVAWCLILGASAEIRPRRPLLGANLSESAPILALKFPDGTTSWFVGSSEERLRILLREAQAEADVYVKREAG
jgi:hypothetical protein